MACVTNAVRINAGGTAWANDTGFDIASNAARANSTGLQTPNVAVTA